MVFPDQKNEYLSEIDHRLAQAEFGEDYVPADRTLYQRNQYILQKEINDEMWVSIFLLYSFDGLFF